MFKVPHPGENHRNSVLIGSRDRLVVAHRAAGLNDCRNPGFGCRIHRIAEREKRIRGQHRASRRFASLFQSNSAAPIRFICPAPTPTVRPSRVMIIALDFTCLTTFQASSISFISASVGIRFVTAFSLSSAHLRYQWFEPASRRKLF